MKHIFMLFIALLFVSCTSASFEEINGIPSEYQTIFVCLDSSKTTIDSSGFFTSGSGTYFYSGTDSASLDTIGNRNIVIKALVAKGYKYTSDIEKADMILLAGNETSEIRTIVSISLLDAKSEDLLYTTSGMYGMGWGIDSDVRNALKNALKGIPARNTTTDETPVEITSGAAE